MQAIKKFLTGLLSRLIEYRMQQAQSIVDQHRFHFGDFTKANLDGLGERE